jgi:hypothetical protein
MSPSLSESGDDVEGEGEAELGGGGDGEVGAGGDESGDDEELSRFEAPLPDRDLILLARGGESEYEAKVKSYPATTSLLGE